MKRSKITFEYQIKINCSSESTPCGTLWVRSHPSDLLPSVVHSILSGLEEIQPSMDKEQQSTITGWIFILSQYSWPRFSQKMRTATERIQKDKTFKYNGLLNFIGESSALEELAWLHNQVM